MSCGLLQDIEHTLTRRYTPGESNSEKRDNIAVGTRDVLCGTSHSKKQDAWKIGCVGNFTVHFLLSAQ